ncbi:suppressor of fused domain protein [Streptomyces sp. NPDC002730]|uniref:suppressor of fused domain protein n=1 Tax=Streptomyces sp. NPDC002730 TaxID=3364662 RepID=UPI00367FFA3A
MITAMVNTSLQAVDGVEAHVRAFFAGHTVEAINHDLGPGRREAVPDLRILVVGPGPRAGCWAYVTAGCWPVTQKAGHGLEFVMTAQVRDQQFIDWTAMVAHYHRGHQLDLEHSMPLGEPWVPNSTCDHLLVSLPYLHGPDLEHCPLPAARWPCPLVVDPSCDLRRDRVPPSKRPRST